VKRFKITGRDVKTKEPVEFEAFEAPSADEATARLNGAGIAVDSCEEVKALPGDAPSAEGRKPLMWPELPAPAFGVRRESTFGLGTWIAVVLAVMVGNVLSHIATAIGVSALVEVGRARAAWETQQARAETETEEAKLILQRAKAAAALPKAVAPAPVPVVETSPQWIAVPQGARVLVRGGRASSNAPVQVRLVRMELRTGEAGGGMRAFVEADIEDLTGTACIELRLDGLDKDGQTLLVSGDVQQRMITGAQRDSFTVEVDGPKGKPDTTNGATLWVRSVKCPQ